MAVLFVSIIPVFKAYIAYDERYFDISFWPIAALLLVVAVEKVEVRQLDNFLYFLFVCSVLSTYIEVALFLLYGRLPALAYEGSISVRFGGFLDDPNGFASILFLLIGWAYYKFLGKKRIIAELLLVGCLFLTQSFTAIGFLVLLVSVFIGIAAYRKPVRLLWIAPVLLVLLSILFVVYESTLSSTVSLLLELKQASINHHVFPWGLWIDQWTKWILLGVTPFEFYESWWNSSLINFGIFWYLANLVLIGALVYSVVQALRTAASRVDRAVLMGVLLFSAYIVFGALNLPMFAIFPINFLFFTFVFLVQFKRVRWQAVSVRRWARRAE